MADEDEDIVLSELDDAELVQQMHDDLYDGLKEEIEEAVNILLERGWAPYDILTQALVEGMRIVGIDFRDGILFVPEVLLSANAMKAGMFILRPLNYLDALEEHKPEILGMSALLTTTMPYMKVVVDTMKEKGIRDDYIVMVGGAPLNEEFADAVGADAYCRDAAVTVEMAKELIARRHNQLSSSD